MNATFATNPNPMTQDQQRITIATACGKDDDYLNNLNAIAQARKILTPDQQVQFSIEVGKLVTRMLPPSRAAWMDFCLINASAQCQCEAFLRTIGKWEAK